MILALSNSKVSALKTIITHIWAIYEDTTTPNVTRNFVKQLNREKCEQRELKQNKSERL